MATLGEGGMGKVYLANKITNIDELVAVKQLKHDPNSIEPNAINRFIREGNILNEFHHENIVKVFNVCTKNKDYFLVLEYVRGGDLSQLIVPEKKLTIEWIVGLLFNIADGLAHAHKKKVIHRDIKPANVLMSDNNVPKLTDFGISVYESAGKVLPVEGTNDYMAPEVWYGTDISYESDIWSFGILAYELLASERPFEITADRLRQTDSISKVYDLDIDKLRHDTPDAIKEMIQQILVVDVKKRLNSMHLILHTLEMVMKDYAWTGIEKVHTPSTAPFLPTKPVSKHETTGEVYRVVVSSTVRDLQEFRDVARDAILGLVMLPIMMEYLPVVPGDAISASHGLVVESDLYVGIFGKRYGYIPDDPVRNPGKLSITHMELKWAEKKWENEAHPPIFIFIQDDSVELDKALEAESTVALDKLDELKDYLRIKYIVGTFTTLSELKFQIFQALTAWERKQRPKFSSTPAAKKANQVQVVPVPNVATPTGVGSPLPTKPVATPFGDILPPIIKYFTGRVSYLDQLEEKILDGESVALYGVVGVGKSAIISALVPRLRHNPDFIEQYDKILYIDLGVDANLFDRLEHWCDVMGINSGNHNNLDERIKAIQKAIASDKRKLIMIDNVYPAKDDDTGINDELMVFRQLGDQNTYIVSTQYELIANTFPNPDHTMEIGALSDSEAFTLIQNIVPNAVQKAPDVIRELIDNFDGLPLPLVFM